MDGLSDREWRIFMSQFSNVMHRAVAGLGAAAITISLLFASFATPQASTVAAILV